MLTKPHARQAAVNAASSAARWRPLREPLGKLPRFFTGRNVYYLAQASSLAQSPVVQQWTIYTVGLNTTFFLYQTKFSPIFAGFKTYLQPNIHRSTWPTIGILYYPPGNVNIYQPKGAIEEWCYSAQMGIWIPLDQWDFYSICTYI